MHIQLLPSPASLLLLLLIGCTEEPQQEPPQPALESPAESKSSALLDGRIIVQGLQLEGYAVELEDDIQAAAQLNLQRVATCLEPLSAQLPERCLQARLVWMRTAPLHADGMHHTLDDVRLSLDGSPAPEVAQCLQGLRDGWQWSAGSEAMPPMFGLTLYFAVAKTPDVLAECAAADERVPASSE